MPAPFRFSVSLYGQPVDQIPTLARRAADAGYSTLTLPDHLDDQPAPLLGLLAAALAVPSIRILPLVLANDFRHPAVLAKEAATVDVLTGGRLELGLGAGWMRSDYDHAGLPYDRPGRRIERLAEAVRVLKELFGDGPVSVEGDHYRITGLEGTPKPVQRPHPPIVLAGGARRMLTLAAQEADIVGLNASMAAGVIDERVGSSATAAATDEKLAWIRDGAGDRFDDLELQTRVHLAVVTDDADGTAAGLGPMLGISGPDTLASPHALIGSVDRCVDTIRRWRDRWGISYITWNAEMIEPLAPVVERLAGT